MNNIMQQWLPIKFAPAHRKVAVHYRNEQGNGRTVFAMYAERGCVEVVSETGDELVDTIDGADFLPEGWYELIESPYADYTYVPLGGKPTYFMWLMPEPSDNYRCTKCGRMSNDHPVDIDEPGADTQLRCDKPQPDAVAGMRAIRTQYQHDDTPPQRREAIEDLNKTESLIRGITFTTRKHETEALLRIDRIRSALSEPAVPTGYIERLQNERDEALAEKNELKRRFSVGEVDREALEACPFCGQRPFSDYVGDEDGGYHEIACGHCNGGGRKPFVGVHAEDEPTARELWNRRALSEPAVLGNCMYCDKPVRFGEQAEQHFSHATCDQQERESVEALEGEKMQPCWGDFMRRIYELGITDPSEIAKAGEPAVPEAVRRLPDQWRGRIEGFLSAGNTAGAGMLEDHADELDRAIAQSGEGRIPEGWKLVPVEPTEAMLWAEQRISSSDPEDIYRAMLAAAPEPDREKNDGQ